MPEIIKHGYIHLWILFASLSSITISAKHLAILYVGSSTLTPRFDMVTFHKYYIKLLATMGTFVILLLPYCQLDFIRERTEIKIMLITCKYIRNDALRLLDFIIAYQISNLRL